MIVDLCATPEALAKQLRAMERHLIREKAALIARDEAIREAMTTVFASEQQFTEKEPTHSLRSLRRRYLWWYNPNK